MTGAGSHHRPPFRSRRRRRGHFVNTRGRMTRTFQALDRTDLEEIRHLALVELDRFLNAAGFPPGEYRRYVDRLIAVCVAQGTAQHLLDLHETSQFDNEVFISHDKIKAKGLRVLADGRVINGIKDIDVWFFFRRDDGLPIPNARHCRKSETAELQSLGERRLDFMKKGIAAGVLKEAGPGDPRDSIRAYLRTTAHGRRFLSRKSMVGLYPEAIFDQVVWATRRLTRGWSGPVG